MSVFKKFWPKPEEADTVGHYVAPDPEPYYSHTDNIDCRYGHAVKGRMPGNLEVELHGAICDCGNIVFISEPCGCPNNPHNELRQHQNNN